MVFSALFPDVSKDTWVLAGLFLVTSVVPEVRFCVPQVTNELQVDEPAAISQEVAERAPEGDVSEPLSSEQDAVVPPFEPLQFQVH